MVKIINPIQKGFYPDPSICRVSDDYYMVHSTFAYAPGIPVFKSRDLKNWTLIGHVLERKEQLQLSGARVSQGIYAPTIRYHNGLFYIIATNVSAGGNFYVTATDPKGPWSDPVLLENAPGIDPSLYFEEDTCYYIGQRTKEHPAYYGDCEIWIQELDIKEKKLVKQPVVLFDGSMKRTIWAEGPHLYKIRGMYYLLLAEGGTEFNHSVTVARSQSLFGPYEACPNNPILTHRHLGHNYPVQCIGHGDLIETPGNEWFMVMLGTRPFNGCAELGRETFLAEFIWEDGWPVVSPGLGKVPECLEFSTLEKEQEVLPSKPDIQWTDPLDMRLIGLRDHPSRLPIKITGDGSLQLPYLPETIEDLSVPAYVGTRLLSRTFHIRVLIESEPKGAEEAGLVYFYNETHYVKVVICERDGQPEAVTTIRKGEDWEEKSRIEVTGKIHEIKLLGHDQALSVEIDNRTTGQPFHIGDLCSQKAGGFTGCTVGVYASSVHETSDRFAVFGPLHVRFFD
ncbi:MAG: glycoside hydrolase family 43 protein [Paenibacillaceae bacterium]|jgi:alpha-N-arabinofuranosidase|nr:glycoside hydrolase family 43 protein [Paenibacillaceae bacterium]